MFACAAAGAFTSAPPSGQQCGASFIQSKVTPVPISSEAAILPVCGSGLSSPRIVYWSIGKEWHSIQPELICAPKRNREKGHRQWVITMGNHDDDQD